MPDDRAVISTGYAITRANEPTDTADPRVPVVNNEGRVFVFQEHPVGRQQKYLGLKVDILLARWEEAWLIQG